MSNANHYEQCKKCSARGSVIPVVIGFIPHLLLIVSMPDRTRTPRVWMLGASGGRQESETLSCVALATSARGGRLSGVERKTSSDQLDAGCSSAAAVSTSYAFASSSVRKRTAGRVCFRPVERTENWYFEFGSRSLMSADADVEFVYW